MTTTKPKLGRPPLLGETASVWMHFKLTPDRKAAYFAHARSKGLSLSQAVFKIMDRTSGFKPPMKGRDK